MTVINWVGVDSSSGVRTIEVVCGDILDTDQDIDLLVVSAFAGSYAPTPGSMIHAMQERGISVWDHSESPEIDLRPSIGVWLSHPIPGFAAKRLLGLEIVGRNATMKDAWRNLYGSLLLLENKGLSAHTLAMPLLGTGYQRLNSKTTAKDLVRHSAAFLERSLHTQRILFVERDKEKAELLSASIDALLRRHRSVLPETNVTDALRSDLRLHIQGMRHRFGHRDARLWEEWMEMLESPTKLESVRFAIQARKLVEVILRRVGFDKGDLASRIREASQAGVASWICSYMHLLRFLGNEFAHSQPEPGKRRPPYVEPDDLMAGLICVSRLLEFWDNEEKGRSATNVARAAKAKKG